MTEKHTPSANPYRDAAEIAADMPKPRLRIWRAWFWRPICFVGGILNAGLMHDLCAPGRAGICWAAGVLGVAASFISTTPAFDYKDFDDV